MSHARYEDWQLLDLAPGAEPAEVNRALHFRRSLYQPGALATYNLLDEDERLIMLDRIDEAYRRITGNEPPRSPGPRPVGSAEQDRPGIEGEAESPPDPKAAPGAHLRFQRRARGLSLEQLSAETKIRASLIGQIEAEVVGELPAAVFVRGHVLQLARALGLADPNELAARYLAKVKLD
jgi:flagellar biosynthesis protein FlhG